MSDKTMTFDPCGRHQPNITPENAAEILDQLLSSPPCSENERELQRLGLIIDISHDLQRSDGLQAALEQGRALLDSDTLAAGDASLLHYFLGNAWEATRLLNRSGWDLHAWEQPELEKQIVHLRWSVRLGTEANIDTTRLCQMYTNLGNLLNHCGRVIEALAAWDAALRLDPDFGMALGNRGLGLLSYAQLVHDPGHQPFHLREAHRSFLRATQAKDSVHREILADFERRRAQLEEAIPSEVLKGDLLRNENFSSGWVRDERSYREWGLAKRLFLNDLNDLDLGPLAAADVQTLPSLTTPLDSHQPSALGFFNQLKQEYVSARYLYFKGTHAYDVHLSDRDVTLINTFDYPAYGYAAEQVKLAFRSSYSLFDKIAFFLNDYLGLNIPERRVSFRGLWYQKEDPKKGLRQELGDPKNRGLKALFWLAKDLHERSSSFNEAMEPEAQEIAAIRHHLEHKYLKLHTEGLPHPGPIGFEALAYSLTRMDFEAKTLRLLQLIRAALIYLAQAVYAEEALRHPPGSNEFIGPMILDKWEDDWKL